MAVRKDWSILASIVNKGLSSINHEEVDNIYKKWVYIEYEPGIAPKTVISYIIKIIAGAIILLLAFFAWNYRLKEEIIQRKKAEEKLQHYAKELEKANIHLKGLDKLKSMFVASMSHELRTPLNSIIGFTGVILQGMAGEINEQQKDQLSRVYRSAKHLLAIISDIIDISKIEAGKVNVFPESFMLAELIDEAVESVLQQLKKKKLSIEVDVPCNLQLVTDRKRLLQCMINFLSNAMKYTEHGGVKVSVREFKNEVEISTADTGIGVAEEDIPKLFMAFERIDTHLLVKAGGTGLGLYLTHKLATELLHGDIAVISEIGKGSTFVLRIPKIIEKEEEE
ncbi:MAG: hypothetical protein KAJ75_07405 [Alphaproteobacteria bacterium]|nr:hypothetical protein [Alphaproteobacteria bacterium]